MSGYGYIEVIQSPLDLKITRVDCTWHFALSLFVPDLSFFWSLGRAMFVIVAFPGYLYLYKECSHLGNRAGATGVCMVFGYLSSSFCISLSFSSQKSWPFVLLSTDDCKVFICSSNRVEIPCLTVFNGSYLTLWSPCLGRERAGCFAFLWFVACVLSVAVCLLFLFGAIGRLCSPIIKKTCLYNSDPLKPQPFYSKTGV